MAAGLDSLAGTQFVQAVSEQFQIELPSSLIFDHPTLLAVAESLFSRPAARGVDSLAILVAAASQLLGTTVLKDEPLMAAGLDSLVGTQFV